eukprot:1156437-Pelagomonas_calceolata.AAC.3
MVTHSMSHSEDERSNTLISRGGVWKPPGQVIGGAGAMPVPAKQLTSRPGAAASGRPGTTASHGGHSLRTLTGRNEAGLYDRGSVLQHAALNSYAVEERALEHEVKRHLLTMPGKRISVPEGGNMRQDMRHQATLLHIFSTAQAYFVYGFTGPELIPLPELDGSSCVQIHGTRRKGV